VHDIEDDTLTKEAVSGEVAPLEQPSSSVVPVIEQKNGVSDYDTTNPVLPESKTNHSATLSGLLITAESYYLNFSVDQPALVLVMQIDDIIQNERKLFPKRKIKKILDNFND
jgi:hypothetical protein